MTRVINGIPFEDVLEDRRRSGDFQWITAEWSAPRYQHLKPRTPVELNKEVLHSQRVQNTMKQLSMEAGGGSLEEIENQAKVILQEMGHTQSLSSIRFIGYFLAKLMKRLYSHIYVSQDGIDKIRNVSTQYPMLFMPTHRSYADFLLLSYVCFHFHIQSPIIAAGLDFLGLKVVRTLLRNCGAFYIRRSFGQDKLYWAIFTEYIQNVLKSGDSPLEFFVEGTRSRSAKSLTPKLGLFLSALELYTTSQVSDLTIVPISIAYDRTLEESLYAYELLGVPKPKESTRGLIKALRIVNENFGNIYFTVGQPISVRDFFKGKIDRSIHNLQPRFLSNITAEETAVCRDLANRVIRTHQRQLYLSPFPLIALVLGQELESAEGGQATLPYLELSQQVLWLRELLLKTGAYVVLDADSESNRWLCQALELHSNIVLMQADGTVQLVVESTTAQPSTSLNISHGILPAAVAHMYLYHYGNQAIQVLLPFAMVASTLVASRNTQILEGIAYQKYEILRKLLQKEFVFEVGHSREDFNFALGVLRNEGIVFHKEGIITVSKSSSEKINFLAGLLKPFLTSYRIVCQFLFSNPGEVSEVPYGQLVRRFQNIVETFLSQKGMADYRTLSLDLLNNCLHALLCAKAVVKVERNSEFVIVAKVAEISHILSEIEFFLGVEDDCLISESLSALPMSKL